VKCCWAGTALADRPSHTGSPLRGRQSRPQCAPQSPKHVPAGKKQTSLGSRRICRSSCCCCCCCGRCHHHACAVGNRCISSSITGLSRTPLLGRAAKQFTRPSHEQPLQARALSSTRCMLLLVGDTTPHTDPCQSLTAVNKLVHTARGSIQWHDRGGPGTSRTTQGTPPLVQPFRRVHTKSYVVRTSSLMPCARQIFRCVHIARHQPAMPQTCHTRHSIGS